MASSSFFTPTSLIPRDQAPLSSALLRAINSAANRDSWENVATTDSVRDATTDCVRDAAADSVRDAAAEKAKDTDRDATLDSVRDAAAETVTVNGNTISDADVLFPSIGSPATSVNDESSATTSVVNDSPTSSPSRQGNFFPNLMIETRPNPDILRAVRLMQSEARAAEASRITRSLTNVAAAAQSAGSSPHLSPCEAAAAFTAAELEDDDIPPAIRTTLSSLRASTMTPINANAASRTSSNATSNGRSRTSSGASTGYTSRASGCGASSSSCRVPASSAAARPHGSAAAGRIQTRRQRSQRIGVRFELNNENRQNAATEAENVTILGAGSSPRRSGGGRSGGALTLNQRRRLNHRECAIADARLARRFPSCLIRTISAIHLVLCLLVLFVQFWTSARVGRERQWVRSVNTYGYICALLAGLAGCSGIALFLQQSKNRAICFLCMSVGTASSCCYLLTFYTSYFAEIRMLPSAKGCIEEYDKHPDFKVPFACMTFLTLVGFFNAFISILVVSTLINRARACWWSCDPCHLCQMDEEIEETLEEDLPDAPLETTVPSTSTNRFSTQFEMPPAYFDHPPPYKP